jgi:hypothetical protein
MANPSRAIAAIITSNITTENLFSLITAPTTANNKPNEMIDAPTRFKLPPPKARLIKKDDTKPITTPASVQMIILVMIAL